MGATKDQAAATHRRLIEAAVETLRERGSQGFTLDAVARKAHVSKGGLLHYFPSKHALYDVLCAEFLALLAARIERSYAQEPQAPGRFARAYIRAVFGINHDPSPLLGVGSVLMATMLERPDMREMLVAESQRWQQWLVDDGLSPGRALVIYMACDAYWTEQFLGLTIRDDAMLQLLAEELIALTRA